MNRVPSLLTALVAIALSACSPWGNDPLAEAQAAYDAQDYITALDRAQAVLAQDTGDPDALELLARSQLAMGQGNVAAATLVRLENSGSQPADANLLAAEAFLQSGSAAAALERIGDDTSAEAWRLRALAAIARGDEQGAIRSYANGRTAAGARGKLFASEATFHLDRADHAAAAEAVMLAQDVAPQRVETMFVSARLAEVQGDQVQALSNYLRIIEIVSMDRPALLAAIAASERAGLPRITRHLITYGAATRPMDHEFVYQRARLDAWDGRWELVRERLQAHEAELENHDYARMLYAEALLQLGQVESARAIATPILARRMGEPEAVRLQGAIDNAIAAAS